MPTIIIRVFAALRESFPSNSVQLEVDTREHITNILFQLAKIYGSNVRKMLIDEKRNTIRKEIIILLNGEPIDHSSRSKIKFTDEDEISIIPPIAGG